MNSTISITHQMNQFATHFSNKNAAGIGELLTDDFALYDPALKWIRGKNKVVELFAKQFKETQKVSYEVIHTYEDDKTGILEFKITLDDLVLYGVDFMHFDYEGKMKELICYYNSPTLTNKAVLKPFSSQAKSIDEGTLYEHYSGKKYKIVSVGRNSESLEEVVVYKAQYGEQDVWVRPLTMFLENVEIDGQTVPRFKQIQS